MVPTLLPAALQHTASTYPDHEAILFENQRLSWQQVWQQVQRLAQAFLDMGVQRGDRIGIICTTRPEYMITFLAATQVGAILVGFNINYTVREITEQAHVAQPVVMMLLHAHPLFAAVRRAIKAMPFVQHCLVIHGPAPQGWGELDALLAQTAPIMPQQLRQRVQSLRPDDGAFMVFSGGISGEMNGAVLSHRNILTSISAQNRILNWRVSDRIILHLPLNHVSGTTLLVIGAVLSGATLLMLERFHPERTLQLVQQEKATILGQVPAMWVMVFSLPHFDSFDLSSVRLAIVSGAPTPAAIMRRIASIAPATLHAYGLTEATGMVTYNDLRDDVEVLLRSAGRVAPEFKLRIGDEEGRPLPPGQVGEVLVSGDCVMMGYFRNAAATRQIIDEQGWLHSGDMGKLDASGYLTLTGRKKRMFISGGYNVFPLEIERYVQSHPAVASCHCRYQPDDIMGEVGILHVRPVPGAELSPHDIRRYCKQGLARYKVPREVRIEDLV
ncbi:MAG: AMP-binding protein [Chloroflexi bacterium]|nr:AMP-binding protein [Chloroflexota bacterium]